MRKILEKLLAEKNTKMKGGLYHKTQINLAINLFKKRGYTKAKGAYSNLITQSYIKYLQEYINSDFKE
jgi:hypothetical protein